jgi:ATP-dependent Clp protease protease subunit
MPNEESPQKFAPRSLARDKLYESRTVLVFGEITTELAEATSRDLLALAAESNDPIRILLHSPGGHVESGDTIFDVIRFIEPTVRILASGWVASAAALIYCAADRANRYALPNTRFLLHEPSGGVKGQATDVEIEARQILAMRARLNRIFAEATGQPYEKVVADTGRNHWMNVEEARDYGLVGTIIQRASELSS